MSIKRINYFNNYLTIVISKITLEDNNGFEIPKKDAHTIDKI